MNLRGDATTEIDTTQGHGFESQIAGFRSIKCTEELESLFTKWRCPGHRILSDSSSGVVNLDLIRKPMRFVTTAGITQETIEVIETRSGKHAFPTDVIPL